MRCLPLPPRFENRGIRERSFVNGPGVYIIELAEPLCTRRRAARFYIGSAKDVEARIEHYQIAKRINRNSFLNEAKRRGIPWQVIYVHPTATVEDARHLEATLKRKKKSGEYLIRFMQKLEGVR
jgi:predicted GIY-YIG superfamily endonuclease